MNPEEGIRAINQELESASNFPERQKDIYYRLAGYYWYMGRHKEAISAAELAGDMALVRYYKDGKNDWMVEEIIKWTNESRERGDYVSATGLVLSYARAGAFKQAYQNFEIAYEKKDPRLVILLILSNAKMFPQNDPGYVQMRKKIISLIDYDWPVK
jgi:tetratricopeptide (TPR) repeat protein